jgi:hypothetical protein
MIVDAIRFPSRLIHRSFLVANPLQLIASGVFLLALAGCSANSDELTRYSISGEVTFEGKEIPLGEIFFQPDSEAGNTGPASSATIVDSRYSLPEEFGVLGGAYVVRISGFSAPGGTATGPLALRGAPLFPDFVTKIDLTKTEIQKDFNVPAK